MLTRRRRGSGYEWRYVRRCVQLDRISRVGDYGGGDSVEVLLRWWVMVVVMWVRVSGSAVVMIYDLEYACVCGDG